MTPWLDIIGVTEAGLAALVPDLRAKVDAAETVFGPARFLAGLDAARVVRWQGSLADMLAEVVARRGRKTTILATGDPNWFGIGATLARHLDPGEYSLHPAVSSFQLAAARLRWPLQHVTTLSLHGRPVARLHPHVLPGNRILALTAEAGTLGAIGALLAARGYGGSLLSVLEHLGGPGETIASFAATEAADRTVGDFYVLAIACVAAPGAPLLPPLPGLPDAAFDSDGQLTKREVRAITLARLAPTPGALLWDVGAGSGSVGIEWMRAAPGARAVCFERDAARCALIAANCQRLGVPDLEIVNGAAPQALLGQSAPDALFLGGGVGDAALFEACIAALKPGGRLVANAVTLDGEAALYARHERLGGDLIRIGVERLDKIGGERVLRPRLSVTQWAMVKGEA